MAKTPIKRPAELEYTPQNCHAREMLIRIGDKWSVYVIHLLDEAGTLRFNELRSQVDGISQRMLTVTLRGMERDGLVTHRFCAYATVADKVMPGFGEQMRAVSLKYVPTAILSRQVAVIRKQALIINLPGQPKAIKETLDGVFAAVPYCIDLIGGPYIETHEAVLKAFRPKSALKKK